MTALTKVVLLHPFCLLPTVCLKGQDDFCTAGRGVSFEPYVTLPIALVDTWIRKHPQLLLSIICSGFSLFITLFRLRRLN